MATVFYIPTPSYGGSHFSPSSSTLVIAHPCHQSCGGCWILLAMWPSGIRLIATCHTFTYPGHQDGCSRFSDVSHDHASSGPRFPENNAQKPWKRCKHRLAGAAPRGTSSLSSSTPRQLWCPRRGEWTEDLSHPKLVSDPSRCYRQHNCHPSEPSQRTVHPRAGRVALDFLLSTQGELMLRHSCCTYVHAM